MKVGIQESINNDGEINDDGSEFLINEEETMPVEDKVKIPVDSTGISKQKTSCRSKIGRVLKLMSFG
jgi:hypothetical protein